MVLAYAEAQDFESSMSLPSLRENDPCKESSTLSIGNGDRAAAGSRKRQLP